MDLLKLETTSILFILFNYFILFKNLIAFFFFFCDNLTKKPWRLSPSSSTSNREALERIFNNSDSINKCSWRRNKKKRKTSWYLFWNCFINLKSNQYSTIKWKGIYKFRTFHSNEHFIHIKWKSIQDLPQTPILGLVA